MRVRTVEGDLLQQDVDVIVNAWNRNLVPWWLLVPQGVSAAIKQRGGPAPFRELARHGPIPLGGAVLTQAGRLPFRGIIHVAGINVLWRSSERSIRASVASALALAQEKGFSSIALPLIGAGTGGGDEDHVQAMILEELQTIEYGGEVVIVRFQRHRKRRERRSVAIAARNRTEGRSLPYAVAFLLVSICAGLLCTLTPGMLTVFAWPTIAWALVSLAYLRPDLGIFAKRGPQLALQWKLILLPHMALLYATWHAIRAVSREPAWASLTEDILIGRRLLPGEYPPVQTIVDLTAELDDHVPDGISYMCCPVLDGAAAPPEALQDMARLISTAETPVYIHCAQGHGRTAMVTAAVLIQRGLATSVDDALAQIRRVRPGARPSWAQMRALRGMLVSEQASPGDISTL